MSDLEYEPLHPQSIWSLELLFESVNVRDFDIFNNRVFCVVANRSSKSRHNIVRYTNRHDGCSSICYNFQSQVKLDFGKDNKLMELEYIEYSAIAITSARFIFLATLERGEIHLFKATNEDDLKWDYQQKWNLVLPSSRTSEKLMLSCQIDGVTALISNGACVQWMIVDESTSVLKVDIPETHYRRAQTVTIDSNNPYDFFYTHQNAIKKASLTNAFQVVNPTLNSTEVDKRIQSTTALVSVDQKLFYIDCVEYNQGCCGHDKRWELGVVKDQAMNLPILPTHYSLPLRTHIQGSFINLMFLAAIIYPFICLSQEAHVREWYILLLLGLLFLLLDFGIFGLCETVLLRCCGSRELQYENTVVYSISVCICAFLNVLTACFSFCLHFWLLLLILRCRQRSYSYTYVRSYINKMFLHCLWFVGKTTPDYNAVQLKAKGGTKVLKFGNNFYKVTD